MGDSVGQRKTWCFKWTVDLQLKMAEYIKENYSQYRESLSSSKKISFLRRMRSIIGFDCNDIQLKNGFSNFLNKYDSVKLKLNSPSFGIDPEDDTSLSKDWILKNCPYYHILDKVMGNRPDITPPAFVESLTVMSDQDQNDGCKKRTRSLGVEYETEHICDQAEDNILTHDLVGERRPANERRNFKWTVDLQLKLAEYLKENYQEYLESLSNSKKISFLRRMRNIIGFDCNDLQLKNGFSNFLNKYEVAKNTLQAYGFGVDRDKDSSLSWILKSCPYYHILDEVMGSRPKKMPPAVVGTACLTSDDINEDCNSPESLKFKADHNGGLENSNHSVDNDPENDSSHKNNILTHDLVGKRRPAVVKKRNERRIKWTVELRLKLAKYLKENYEEYLESLSNSKKISFLRRMRNIIGFDCNDRQLKNGFSHFLNKYRIVKGKLNASRSSGIDPDDDSSLSKGWILKTCPYYYILDEIMGSRPDKMRPTKVVATACLTSEDFNENSGSTGSLKVEADHNGESSNHGVDSDPQYYSDQTEDNMEGGNKPWFATRSKCQKISQRLSSRKVRDAIQRKRKGNFATQSSSLDAVHVNYSDTRSTSRRKLDLYSASSSRNATAKPQTVLTSEKKEVTVSSLYFNTFGRGDNEETERIYQNICDDEILTKINSDDSHQDISAVSSKGEDKRDQLGDNLDLCLVCGHEQTVKVAKKAASSFQWKLSGNKHNAPNDKLSSDSCVDIHLLPMFVLRTLLKFPKEECVKIYKRTFGVSNPADWFILCQRCVEVAHQAYRLKVKIRRLEKKFFVCQKQVLRQVKVTVRNTFNNDDIINSNILTVREQILSYYAEEFLSGSTVKSKPESSNPCKNHISKNLNLVISSPTQSQDEHLDVGSPSPEPSTSAVLKKSIRHKKIVNRNNNKICRKKRKQSRILTRILNVPKPRVAPIRMKTLAMKKNQDELIAKHSDRSLPNEFRCKLCPLQFNANFLSRQDFVRHLSTIHRPVWEPVSEFVQCDQCGKSLRAGTGIQAHVRKHHPTVCPHICNLCGIGYYTEASLNNHAEKHASGELKTNKQTEQTHICDYCGVECKRLLGLRKHIRRFHRKGAKGLKGPLTGRAGITSQRPCKHCDVVCINLHELQSHLKKVHPELYKHKCEECNSAYISKQGLQIHVDSIHRQTKLYCKNCPKVVSTTAQMSFHIRYRCQGHSNQNL